MTDLLPTGLTFVSMTGDAAKYSCSANVCTSLVPLAKGSGAPITVTAKIDATFTGNSQYAAATTNRPFDLHPQGTGLTLNPPDPTINGNPTTLTGTLTDTTGAPLSGRPLTLTMGSGTTAQTCTAPTDATGAARCVINPTQPPGTTQATPPAQRQACREDRWKGRREDRQA